jgi:MarR family transcriptional regulator, 2-MHQ and catechol-resistance regulon repressor
LYGSASASFCSAEIIKKYSSCIHKGRSLICPFFVIPPPPQILLLALGNYPRYLPVEYFKFEGDRKVKTKKQYSKKIDLALALWVKLARAHDTFSHLTAANIREFKLTPAQFGVVECLGHLGPMLIGDLTRKHLVSGGNMTVVVDNLEKEGIVERVVDKEDRRAYHVRLTRKGKRLFDKIFVKHAEYVASLTSVLMEPEQEQLGILLRKLGLALKEVK